MNCLNGYELPLIVRKIEDNLLILVMEKHIIRLIK